MSAPELISVYGPPCSGKTVLSIKLGIELAKSGNSVAIICCDRTVPALPVLFPQAPPGELRSLGEIFSASDISEQDILAAASVVNEYPDMIFLGYTLGDNMYTWPSFSDRRAGMMIEAVKKLVSTVIIDCCSDINADALTSFALKTSGTVINIYTPDLKTVSFYESQLPLITSLGNNEKTVINLLNHPANDILYPSDEMNDYLEDKIIFPYCRELKQQFYDGKTVKCGLPGKPSLIIRKILKSTSIMQEAING